ncbi:hypothetical protein U6B65_01300 [Oscillospiraceae bacterium MB08-C2-2]|nr:hypothetical protein U6B65_01300 [Oscillospiraceae bacterium MB08-C2-2]
MNILLVLLAFAGIGAMDIPHMVAGKRWRDLVVYSILFLLVLTLGMIVAMDIRLPSTIKVIQAFYRDVLGWSFHPN